MARKIVTEAQQAFSFTRRSFVLGAAQLGVGGILAGRMAWLSVAQNEKYALLAESNRVNLTLTPPRRGWIVDRAGKPLALNRTSFRVDLIPDRIQDKEQVLGELGQLLALTHDEIERIREDIDKSAGFQPVQVAENLDIDRFAAVSIRANEMPGVAPAQSYARYYPEGAAVGHLLGYVGAASASEYEKTKDPLMITPGFKVGKAGIEAELESSLRGAPASIPMPFRTASASPNGRCCAKTITSRCSTRRFRGSTHRDPRQNLLRRWRSCRMAWIRARQSSAAAGTGSETGSSSAWAGTGR